MSASLWIRSGCLGLLMVPTATVTTTQAKTIPVTPPETASVAEPEATIPPAAIAPPEIIDTAPETLSVPSATVEVLPEAGIVDTTDYSLGATTAEEVSVPLNSIPRPEAPLAIDAPVPSIAQGSRAEPAIAPGSTIESAMVATPMPPTRIPSVAPAAVPVKQIAVNRAAPSASVRPYFDPKLVMPSQPALPQDLSFRFPVAIPAMISSLFGWRIHPVSGVQRMHTGTDIAADAGTPVLAAMPGRVILADNMGGYGLTVAIEHSNGMVQTLYAHLSTIFVKPGELVPEGAVIGQVGSTGASTGPHLHFELRKMQPDQSWVAQDPGQYLQRSLASLTRSLQLANKQP